MSRHYFLVTYDISDDKRRNRVFTALHAFGEHVQYSVFFCELNDREFVHLRHRLRREIHHGEDQVLMVDVGVAARPLSSSLHVLGMRYQPSVRTIVV
jgi:CRISPR-associated protein Cas2